MKTPIWDDPEYDWSETSGNLVRRVPRITRDGHPRTLDRARSLFLADVLRIGPDKWRQHTRMTPAQAHEWIFERRGSIGLAGVPCWLWGEIVFDEDGGIFDVALDLGYYGRGVWITNSRTGRRANVRYNIAADRMDSTGAWEMVFGSNEPFHRNGHGRAEDLLRAGVALGQTFLLVADARWVCVGYETEEWDLEWTAEIVHVEGEPATDHWDRVLSDTRLAAEADEALFQRNLAQEIAFARSRTRASRPIPTPEGQRRQAEAKRRSFFS